jgi:hypothetical protein
LGIFIGSKLIRFCPINSNPTQPFQNVKVKVLNDRVKVMRFELSV